MIRAAIVAALLFAAPLQTAVADDGDEPRTISVSGRGEVMAPPDMARVHLGVTSEGNTAPQALTQNSRAMEALMKALREAEVGEKDIRTLNVSLSPLWTMPEPGDQRPKIRGYQASNTVMVTARDLAALGPLLDAATKAGATDIGGISFDISEREARMDEARTAAVEDARRKAQLYAQAADATLGPVVSIVEGGGWGPRPPQPMMRMAVAEAASVPISGGEETLGATVSVTFELR